MSDLDDKLRDIIMDDVLLAVDSGQAYVKDVDTAVSLIKQAFADEGYEKFVGGRKWGGYENPNGELVEIMTGQEFYDRFMGKVEILTNKLPEIVRQIKDAGLNKAALAATVGSELDRIARKAAGL